MLFCGHSFGKPHGIVECWPALARFDVIRFLWYKSLDYS
jgi:hypothetical protein